MGTFECDTCTRVFNTWHACKQHMTAIDHWVWENECETCTARFRDSYDAEDHMDEKNHFAYDYKCETCNLAFRFEDDRDEHQDDEGHYKHLHCSDCDRYFRNENNLDQHMKSRIHQGANIQCPFCKTGFTTASGVTHHLERASCPNAPNIDRSVIHRVLRQRDTQGIFTERLLEWHGSDDDKQVHWNPISAWNGSSYECYICHRGFRTCGALSQHLASPAHQAPLYHCPNKSGSCGGKKFSTLAALFNHLESGSCGYARFSTVQKSVNGFLTGGSQKLIRY